MRSPLGLVIQTNCSLPLGLHIPANNTLLVEEISSKLAQREKHLTLEFLSEAVTSLQKNDTAHKQYVLLYIRPWLFNLDKFCSVGEEREKKKIHNILAVFIQLSISSAELFPTLQAEIWQSIATVPSILEFVLDYFFKAGYHAGLKSVKAEMLTETTVTLASVNPELVAQVTINTMLKVCTCTLKCVGRYINLPVGTSLIIAPDCIGLVLMHVKPP